MQSRSIDVGDVVLYQADGKIQVGEVYFHAKLDISGRGEIFTCLSNWPVKVETNHWKKVKVREEFTILPSACVQKACIYTPADVGSIATVLVPAF